jgi:hypothetical protein
MHNPRGSNNRLNGAGTNRASNNRLFDSQNNAKGGYCWGPAMSYYEGSELSIEWTNQHGCGNPKLECNIVIQYMCGLKEDEPEDQIRDGVSTTEIPDSLANYNAKTGEDFTYGMHENYYYFKECQARDRNGGLFIADRNVGNNAQSTRQNNGGGKRGFECNEERDYYPYWHPSPWKDIAILTNSLEQCNYYQTESQNVIAKGHCKGDFDPKSTTAPKFHKHNSETECTADGKEWEEVEAWNIPPPECVLAPWNRHNHLGNGVNGFNNMYNWTLPTRETEECVKDDECACVLRVRYNVSTGDINGWGLRNKGDDLDEQMSDLTQNKDNSPVKQDPMVPLPNDSSQNLSLALNTNQYGRTFQDRSHVFHIRPRPDGMSLAARIYNLNVRGKRGNIVQTYPATEYDFVPSYLEVKVGDFVHFQWTGCDTNPQNYAGEGTDQTDRSNIVQLPFMDGSYPASDEWLSKNTPMFDDGETRQRMAHLDQENCLDYEQLKAKHANSGNQANDIEEDVQNCMKLNAHKTPYFDGGLHAANNTGRFSYYSTRNNNFTNRGQKGELWVATLLELWAIILIAIAGTAFVGAGAMAGGLWYSQANPQSGMAQFFDGLSA